MKHTRRTDIRPALIAALVVLSGILAAPRAEAAKTVPCDIQRGHCSTTTEDGISITFDILPKPVTAMSELTFVVILTKRGAPIRDAAITLDLGMPGMYMGRNRLSLNRVSDGKYEGKGVMTRCASGKKIWQAEIRVTSADKSGAAVFVFEVK